MFLRVCGLGVVLLALVVGVTPGQDAKTDVKEIVGKVKEVDAKKKVFILSVGDKVERTFMVDKSTKFTGPRGSDRDDGLKDDCMGAGYEVRVVPAADEKIAKEVKLSAWKGAESKKKKGK